MPTGKGVHRATLTREDGTGDLLVRAVAARGGDAGTVAVVITRHDLTAVGVHYVAPLTGPAFGMGIAHFKFVSQARHRAARPDNQLGRAGQRAGRVAGLTEGLQNGQSCGRRRTAWGDSEMQVWNDTPVYRATGALAVKMDNRAATHYGKALVDLLQPHMAIAGHIGRTPLHLQRGLGIGQAVKRGQPRHHVDCRRFRACHALESFDGRIGRPGGLQQVGRADQRRRATPCIPAHVGALQLTGVLLARLDGIALRRGRPVEAGRQVGVRFSTKCKNLPRRQQRGRGDGQTLNRDSITATHLLSPPLPPPFPPRLALPRRLSVA